MVLCKTAFPTVHKLRTACPLDSRTPQSVSYSNQTNMAHSSGLLQVVSFVLAVAAVAGAGAEGNATAVVHVQGQDYGSSRVVVPCTRDIFAGTKFYGSSRNPGLHHVAEWITR
jgi:hypothetical protein